MKRAFFWSISLAHKKTVVYEANSKHQVQRVVKSGYLHNVLRAGEHDVFGQNSLSLRILLRGFQLWLGKSENDSCSELPSGKHGNVSRPGETESDFGRLDTSSSTLIIFLKYILSWREETWGIADGLTIAVTPHPPRCI